MAEPAGNGTGSPPRDSPSARPHDRPEAFGRGEHPQDQKKDQQGEQKKDGDDKEDDKPKDERPFWKRPVLMAFLIGFFVIAGIAGTLYLVHAYHFESTDDAFIDGRIARIAPRVAGKVLQLDVDDNDVVEADTPLITIDPQPFQVRKSQAVASELQAEAQFKQAQANEAVAQASAAQADADVTVAEVNAKNAKQDFDRFQRVQAAARSQVQVDQATANQGSSVAQVTSAHKKADAMHAQADAAAKTVDSMAAAVKSAQSQVDQADLDLSYTKVVAGHRGRVTQRRVEVGNYVSVGQELLDVVPTDVPDDIWVTANFKETQLTHMMRGQHVTITIDAYPDEKLRGHVDSFQNGTGGVFSLLPPENATGNYVKVVQRVPVKIILDEQPRHLLSPGLSVEPEVDITERPDTNASETSATHGPPPNPPNPRQ